MFFGAIGQFAIGQFVTALSLPVELNAALSPTPRKLKYPRDAMNITADITAQGTATARAKVIGSGTSRPSASVSVEVSV